MANTQLSISFAESVSFSFADSGIAVVEFVLFVCVMLFVPDSPPTCFDSSATKQLEHEMTTMKQMQT